MKLLRLSIGTLVLRFYLMMAIILIAGFSGIWMLAGLAVLVFYSCLMGIQFDSHFTIRKSRKANAIGGTTGKHHVAH